MAILRSNVLKLAGYVLVLSLLAGCGGSRMMDMRSIGFDRQIDSRYLADSSDSPQGRPGQFDVSEWFGATTLDGHVPLLMVDRRMDVVVMESGDERAVFEWNLPSIPDALLLRFSDRNFDPGSCPVGGTPADDVTMECIDGDRPLRGLCQVPGGSRPDSG